MSRRVALLAALWSLVLTFGLSAGGCASSGATPAASRAGATALALLDDPALSGTRWGLMVVTAEGEPVAERLADGRFIPASNTKIFTTTAAFALLEGLEAADPDDGTAVRLEARTDEGAPDVAVIGSGDPALGDGPDCVSDCLAELADLTAARVTRVGDVIGDDRLFPDERWGPGWSWEDMQAGFGTAASALTVNDNVVVLEVAPADGAGAPVRAQWRSGDELQPLENRAITIEAGEADLRLERRPGEEAVRLYGRMPLNAPPTTLKSGWTTPP